MIKLDKFFMSFILVLTLFFVPVGAVQGVSYDVVFNTSLLGPGEFDVRIDFPVGDFVESDFRSFVVGVLVDESEDAFFENVTFIPETNTSISNTSSVVVIPEWNISVSNQNRSLEVVLPQRTSISSSSGNRFNVGKINASVLEVEDVLGLVGAKGVARFGVFGESLIFSNPVLLRINIDEEYNGLLFNVFRSSTGNQGTWNNIGTCTVTGGVCEFNTTQASFFAVAQDVLVDESSSTRRSSRGWFVEEVVDVEVEDEPVVVEEVLVEEVVDVEVEDEPVVVEDVRLEEPADVAQDVLVEETSFLDDPNLVSLLVAALLFVLIGVVVYVTRKSFN
ncbi:MAG: hypothetical protein ACMXX9_02155 [Candidatus Woesearchaeota archaeon]